MSSTTETAPQDSVLRRHWEASRQLHSNTGHISTSSSSDTSSQDSKGGFFTWLKSLFN